MNVEQRKKTWTDWIGLMRDVGSAVGCCSGVGSRRSKRKLCKFLLAVVVAEGGNQVAGTKDGQLH